MTRLNSEQLIGLGSGLHLYDQELVQKTGCTLRQIAAKAVGITEDIALRVAGSSPVSVIPVTTGQGIIQGFVEAINDIIIHIGFNSRITAGSDVSGLAEAVECDSKIVFLADDNKFVALNFSSGIVIDNAHATARGYVFALDSMVKGLRNRNVLVIGAGRVGRSVVFTLKKLGAAVTLYDLDRAKAFALASDYCTDLEEDLDQALGIHRIIFCAAPAHRIIRAEHVRPDTVIAAPGIPACFNLEVYNLLRERLIHDPLQIGVATMLLGAACSGRAKTFKLKFDSKTPI